MTADKRQKFEQALAEEQAANIEAAKEVLPRLQADCEQAVQILEAEDVEALKAQWNVPS